MPARVPIFAQYLFPINLAEEFMLRAGVLACREGPLFTSRRQGDHRQITSVVPECRSETGECDEDREGGYPRAHATAFHKVPEAEEEYERDGNGTGDPFLTVCGRDL